MIREKELNSQNHPMNAEQRKNFLYHYYAVNELRAEFGKPMHCTSGFRTLEQHIRLYSRMNEKREQMKLKLVPIPMKSKHLVAAASDYYDPETVLYKWCEENTEHLVELGIYVEKREPGDRSTHTHLQTLPPFSKSRFFDP